MYNKVFLVKVRSINRLSDTTTIISSRTASVCCRRSSAVQRSAAKEITIIIQITRTIETVIMLPWIQPTNLKLPPWLWSVICFGWIACFRSLWVTTSPRRYVMFSEWRWVLFSLVACLHVQSSVHFHRPLSNQVSTDIWLLASRLPENVLSETQVALTQVFIHLYKTVFHCYIDHTKGVKKEVCENYSVFIWLEQARDRCDQRSVCLVLLSVRQPLAIHNLHTIPPKSNGI